METIRNTVFILCFALLIGCATKYVVPVDSTNNHEFVGQWSGEHYNEKGDYWRRWTQVRNADGSYNLTLKYYDKTNKHLNTLTEKGLWWIKDNQYHEINPARMSEPESYTFTLMANNQIQFSSTKIDDSSDENVGYVFIDTKEF